MLAGHCAACCVVLLHRVCVWEHVCATTARVLGGLANFPLCRSSGVLARRSSDVLAKQCVDRCFARTSLERLARTPVEPHNQKFVAPPRTLAVAAHTCSQTHTRCSNTTQHAAQCPANTIDHEPQTTYQRPQTTDHQQQTTNHRPQTTNHRPPATNQRPQTNNHRQPTTDHRPQTTNHTACYSTCAHT